MIRRVVHVGKAEMDSFDISGLGNEDVLEAKMRVYNGVLMVICIRAHSRFVARNSSLRVIVGDRS